ncbi:hypothetical protein NFI96_033243 [Prochilodus magdalenae]|nr:hypothetical protein NFI96_033243 [Prochilodus magdalenae]
MNLLVKQVFKLFWLFCVPADTVSCLISQDCVLPCKSGYHDVIHWQKVDSEKASNVHSFYSGSDQLGHQDKAYKDRTSLFSDQISNGNISLILRRVRIQDRGRYKCYTAITSANREAFINVNVKAPIKSVDIKMTDDGITCNTRGVYPEPRISWTINGKSQNSFTTKTDLDSQGLYTLASILPAQLESLTYTCSISFEDGTQTYNTSLTHEKTEIISGENIIFHCPKGEAGNFTLTYEGSSTVLSYDGQTSQQDIKWNGIDVKITREGNIALFKVDSEKHSGTYTCERITTRSRQIMETSVQIKSASTTGIIIGVCVVVAVVVVVAVAVGLVIRKHKWKPCMELKRNGQKSTSTDTKDEQQELKNPGQDNGQTN